jgi:DNA replication protein DnaC
MKDALNNKSISRYYINTAEGINKVINHFNKYPLLTNKKISFEY